MIRLLSPLLLFCTLAACVPTDPDDGPFQTQQIPPEEQRIGEAAAGYDYLLYGDYVGSGVPADMWLDLSQPDNRNLLERSGDSAQIAHAYNLFEAPNGVEVVGGLNCFGCHAGFLEGEFVVGLGNSAMDFTSSRGSFYDLLEGLIINTYGEDSPEWAASEPLVRGAQATSPWIETPFVGPSPAMRLEQVAAAHRIPGDLSWSDDPRYNLPQQTIASDVPPWWNVGKKNALYYNGMGRGDIARMLMQISVVGLIDLAQAQSIDSNMPDVYSWLLDLEAPVYSGTIDESLAANGQNVFEDHCSRCHGSYGEDDTYPNLLVHLDEVGTDPEYAMYFIDNPELPNWFNDSWYGVDGNSKMQPEPAYIAPPLDGIWASAPYLHNGSVPTLRALLDSSQRPSTWRRDFSGSAYDHENLGHIYTVPDSPDIDTYDTAVTGYGNQGHTFGDALSTGDRDALLEYLKTL